MIITEGDFRRLWGLSERTIPVDVALVHARAESSLDVDAYNPETAYNERHGLTGAAQVHAYGLFQMLNVNFSDPERITQDGCFSGIDDKALFEMEEYDGFAGRIYDPGNERVFFRRYNGSGDAAERYADRLMAALSAFRGGVQPAGGVGVLAVVGLVVGIAALS